MKQTAVEWFFMTMNIRGLLPNDEIVECYEQAKEIFEQQIMDAWNNGNNKYSGIGDAEVYYNEIFKNK